MIVTGVNTMISSLFSSERGETSTPLLVALGIVGFAAAAYFIFGALGGGEEVDSTPIAGSSSASESSGGSFSGGGSAPRSGGGGSGSRGGGASAQASYQQPECGVNKAVCDCEDFGFDSNWATWFLNTHDKGNTHRLDSDGDGSACEEGAEKLAAP